MATHVLVMVMTLFMLALQIEGAARGVPWSVFALVFLGGCLAIQMILAVVRLK